jgi:hypothetical protein
MLLCSSLYLQSLAFKLEWTPMDAKKEFISVIIPVKNSSAYLLECLQSIIRQTYTGRIEVSIFNDESSVP